MREFTYYSVWGEVIESDKCIKIMGNNVQYNVYDKLIGFEHGEPIEELYTVVSRVHLRHILNTEWDMNKTESFIEKLAVKLERMLDKMHSKK